MGRESTNMQIDYPFTNADGSGIKLKSDGSSPQKLGVGGEVVGSFLWGKQSTNFGAMGGSNAKSLSKRVNRGVTDQWLLRSESVGVISPSIGSKDLTLRNGYSIVNDNTNDVYQSWRYDGGQIISGRLNLGETYMGNVVAFDGTADTGGVISDTDDYLSMEKEWTLQIYFFPVEGNSGYVICKAGATSSERFAIRYAGDQANFYFGDTVIAIEGDYTNGQNSNGYVIRADRWNSVVIRNKFDGTNYSLDYACNGNMGVNDISGQSIPVNSLPISIGGRFDDDLGSGSLTTNFEGSIANISIYDRALSDNEMTSFLWNPKIQNVCYLFGSSSMYGAGVPDKNDSIAGLIANKYSEDSDTIFWNFGRGGYTFYHHAPDDYIKPDYIGDLARPSVDTLYNVEQGVKRISADIAIYLAPSNFTSQGLAETPFTLGPNEWSECIDAESAMQEMCCDYGCVFIGFTKNPKSGSDFNGDLRGDVHRRVSEAQLRLGNYISHWVTAISENDNSTNPRYDSLSDPGHLNEYGYKRLFNQAELHLDPIFNSTKLLQN